MVMESRVNLTLPSISKSTPSTPGKDSGNVVHLASQLPMTVSSSEPDEQDQNSTIDATKVSFFNATKL